MSEQYLVWVPEQGETEDDGREVKGIDAEDAAESYAERLCWGDPDYYAAFLDRDGMAMHVREVESGEVSVFQVTGERVITFNAREKKQ